MQPVFSFRNALKLVLCISFLAADLATANGLKLFSEPQDQEVLELRRNSSTALNPELILTKNLYRQEAYEAEYEVSVPYEAIEDYYESVPYEVDEAYEDTEYYTEYENVCRNVPYPVRRCRNEEVCRPPRRERRCVTVPVCGHGSIHWLKLLLGETAQARPGRGRGNGPDNPGTPFNPPGPPAGPPSGPPPSDGWREDERRKREEEHRRGEEERRRRDEEERRRCRNVEKCEDVEIDRGECRTVEKCHQENEYRQECKMEPVTKSRSVTKYRRVTRYRDELRQRTVTRYRSETRCCETRYRPVFDRQMAIKAQFLFPAESALVGKEEEKFKVTLTGDDSSPQLKVQVISSVFGYAPEVRYLGGQDFQITMTLKPKLSAKDFGKDKISALALIADGNTNFVQIRDLGTRSRFVTDYSVKVMDAKGAQVLAKADWQTLGEQKNHEVKLLSAAGDAPTALLIKSTTKVKILLTVKRSSLLLDQPVNFNSSVAGAVTKALEYDTKPFLDPNLVGKIVVSGKLEAAVLSFVDSTKNNAEVVSKYRISVMLADGNVIGSAEVARKDLKTDSSGRYKLGLKKDLGMAADKLALLKVGTEISVEMEIDRSGRRFNPNPSMISKKQTQKIK